MAHAVESHPQKDYIVQSLLSGVSTRKIAATITPTIHYTSLHAYQMAKLRPALRAGKVLAMADGLDISTHSQQVAAAVIERATEALRAPTQVDPYLARVAKHQKTVDTCVQAQMDSEDGPDGRTVAALIATDLKGLELDAKLTGRLEASAGGNTTIQIVTPAVTINTAPSGGFEPLAIDIGPER